MHTYTDRMGFPQPMFPPASPWREFRAQDGKPYYFNEMTGIVSLT